MMLGSIWWYATRSSGLVLWVLVALSIMWGFAVSTRLIRRRGLPAWMLDLHRHLSWLASVFTVVHLVCLWADSYTYFGPAELFVPMASTWKPGAVTWGIVAFYLLALVQVTSWFMRRLPRRVWHAVHLSSVPLLITGTVHGIMAGADRSARVVLAIVVLCGTAIVWLAVFRLLGGNVARSDERGAAIQAARAARVAAAPRVDVPAS